MNILLELAADRRDQFIALRENTIFDLKDFLPQLALPPFHFRDLALQAHLFG